MIINEIQLSINKDVQHKIKRKRVYFISKVNNAKRTIDESFKVRHQ